MKVGHLLPKTPRVQRRPHRDADGKRQRNAKDDDNLLHLAYLFTGLHSPGTDSSDVIGRGHEIRQASTTDQTTENQLLELRRYCEARDWRPTEYVDQGVSGAKDRRLALDRLMTDVASRRMIEVVVCWRLDRFGHNLRHLVVSIEELAAAGVAFVSLGENIDTTSPTGRLMLGILGSFARYLHRATVRRSAMSRDAGLNLPAVRAPSSLLALDCCEHLCEQRLVWKVPNDAKNLPPYK